MGCQINEEKGTNVEHSFQNNNIQKNPVILYLTCWTHLEVFS